MNTEKAIVFDSGTLINLSMNGFLPMLEELKKTFSGKFLITKAVKYETVDRPIGIKRFELGALRVQSLIDSGVLEMPSSLGIPDSALQQETNKLMNIANHCLQVNGRWLNIVSEGEMSCLALSNELSERGIQSIIAVDERTTRILAERSENLENIMSERLHQNVKLVQKELGVFAKYRFIRSSEIVYVAFKKGLLKISGPKALEAALYATKFHGAAISFEEIDEIKKS